MKTPTCYTEVDVAALLEEPDMETDWRCEGIVADGSVTLLAGSAGDGKTWLAHGLAAGVARGEPFAGINCTQGNSLVIDAEMGARMSIKRFRIAGIGPEVALVDAMGLDLSNDDDFAFLEWDIERKGANFVVLDSLRKLTPGKRENDSDDMAPLVAKVGKLARDTSAAIVLIHHRGKGESHAYRGSTAIGDQSDAVAILSRKEGNLRRLTYKGGKPPRYAPEPDDFFLRFAPEEGGFVAAEAPSSDEQFAADILEAAPAPNKAQLAQRVRTQSGAARFIRICAELEEEGHVLIAPGSTGGTDNNTAGERVRFTQDEEVW
jgi:archaellum biogenesis ATPase FlaH